MSRPSNDRLGRLFAALVPAVLLLAGVALAEQPTTTASPEEAATEVAPDAAAATPPTLETESAEEVAPAAKAPNASDHTASVASSEVALARFTTAVENREPIDAIAFLSSEATQIIFFTDLRGLSGETVTHRWEFGGEVMAEVPFDVGSNRFRVWSSKQLKPVWLGEWTVSVVKSDGEILATESFTFQE